MHGDKPKPCYGDTPASWIVPAETGQSDGQGGSEQLGAAAPSPETSTAEAGHDGAVTPSPTTSSAEVQSRARQPVRRRRPVQEERPGDVDGGRPVREKRLPGRFADYSM